MCTSVCMHMSVVACGGWSDLLELDLQAAVIYPSWALVCWLGFVLLLLLFCFFSHLDPGQGHLGKRSFN